MKEEEIYNDFIPDEDTKKAILENHCELICCFGVFLINFDNDTTFDSDRIIELLIKRSKIEGSFATQKGIDNCNFKIDENEEPLEAFINYFHRLIETPVYKYEWVEFKKLLKHYNK